MSRRYVSYVEGKGRAVFSGQRFLAGEVIESSPVLLFKKGEKELVEKTNLFQFYYNWKDGGAIGLGFTSLYNHSANPNVSFTKNYDKETIEMRALQDISADEELTIDYHKDYDTEVTLWFESKE